MWELQWFEVVLTLLPEPIFQLITKKLDLFFVKKGKRSYTRGVGLAKKTMPYPQPPSSQATKSHTGKARSYKPQ